METMHILAETFNYIILQLFNLLLSFFQFNFTFVSYVIQTIEAAGETVSANVLAIFNVLNCYYQDFVLFIFEVKEITQFVLSVTFNFIYKVYLNIANVIYIILDCLNYAYQTVANFFYSIGTCFVVIQENVLYLLHLIFNSLILILQLGPNLLILVGTILVNLGYYMLLMLHTSVLSLAENVHTVCSLLAEAIYSIPVKAYFGALLLLMLFYQYEIVIACLKAYFSLLFLFLVQILKYVGYGTCICLKPVTVAQECVCKVYKYFFSHPKITEEVDSVQQESTSHLHSNPHSQLVQKQNLFQSSVCQVKSFFKKYLFRSVHTKEQIEQLQRELIAEREKHICIICCDRPRNIILYPCRHMCICEECLSTWNSDLKTCPLCRQHILHAYHVYT